MVLTHLWFVDCGLVLGYNFSPVKVGEIVDKCTFGKYLAKCRRSKGITQEQLADMLHVHVNSIKNIEGGFSYPSLEHFFTLMQILHFSVDRLCYDEYGLSDLGLGGEIQDKINRLSPADKEIVTNTLRVLLDGLLKNRQQ